MAIQSINNRLFLCILKLNQTYNFAKAMEKNGKYFRGYMRGGDVNVSVQDSLTYSRRFNRMIINSIAEDNNI